MPRNIISRLFPLLGLPPGDLAFYPTNVMYVDYEGLIVRLLILGYRSAYIIATALPFICSGKSLVIRVNKTGLRTEP